MIVLGVWCGHLCVIRTYFIESDAEIETNIAVWIRKLNCGNIKSRLNWISSNFASFLFVCLVSLSSSAVCVCLFQIKFRFEFSVPNNMIN